MKKKLIIELKKIERNETIGRYAFHSMDGGQSLNPLVHEESEGLTPSEFSNNRSFWRLISIESCGEVGGLESAMKTKEQVKRLAIKLDSLREDMRGCLRVMDKHNVSERTIASLEVMVEEYKKVASELRKP